MPARRDLIPPPSGPWPPGPMDPVLQPSEVHLWFVELPEGPVSSTETMALSADEKQRADRFRRERIRSEWIAGRHWLRLVLGRYLRWEPQDIRFDYRQNGKPILTPSGSGLRFNLAHSGGAALLAVSEEEVGVDLERSGRFQPSSDLVGDVFSESEQGAFDGIEGPDREALFLRGWVRKEALLKGVGEGLSRPPRSVTVLKDLPEPSWPVPFQVSETEGVFRGWTLWDVVVEPGIFAAVATSLPDPSFLAWTEGHWDRGDAVIQSL